MTYNKNIWALCVIVGTILCVSTQMETANAAPTANIHKSSDSHTTDGKNGDNSLNQGSDEEVLELEHLKHPNGANTKEEILPSLVKQLEEEAEASENSSSDEEYDDNVPKTSEKTIMSTLQHHPTHHLQENHQQLRLQNVEDTSDNERSREKPVKLLPGAARLTFGQHYVEPPTTSTTTETSMPEEVMNEEITNNGQRRAYDPRDSKQDNAEVLLRHSGGQYSAFDMAQYVFWTGDEAGVARAVEELIHEGLMTRENAIKFLRDIRLGIDYLQNTYSSRSFPENTKEKPENMEIVVTTTSTTTTQQPIMESNSIDAKPTLSPEILKVIEKLPSLLKLNELNEKKETAVDYDDVVGRLRLADFLYAEYSLEEVIYQLAKVMFSQSLTRGSEQAQNALQKLTGFLEAEGQHGRISPALQKKVLDVLLAALSDTLAENPELLNAARTALGEHIDKISQHLRETKH